MSKTVSEGEHIVEKQTALEFWFTPVYRNADVDMSAAVPPRYKMAIVITPIIFVPVSPLLSQVRLRTIGFPVLISTLVEVGTMVLLMMYVIMPSVTKLLRPWLSRKRLF